MTKIQPKFRGTYTALATPFTADSSAVDFDSLADLIEFQLAAKVDGLVICGSTGEALTLTDDEYVTVLQKVRSIVAGRVPLIAGVGGSSTVRSVDCAKKVNECGYDGILLVAPPYNKPTQEGIYQHFGAVHAATKLPIIAYNIPGRTAVTMSADLINRLHENEIIVGLKDSTGSIDQLLDLLSLLRSPLAIFSGEDSLVNALMASGGHGVISASANLLPSQFVALTQAALAGDFRTASRIQIEILPIVRALFSETNPIPVKAALAIQGVIRHNAVRLPLLPARPETIERLQVLLSAPKKAA